MKIRHCSIWGVLAVLALAPAAGAQMTPWFQWTFLPQNQTDLIAGEASGETALSHVIAWGGMPRNRKHAEYAGTFFEVQYLLGTLKDYGIEDVEVFRFPGGETWDGVAGELWEVQPRLQKLASYTDLRAMLVQGSTNADVTAELVWVGEGGPKDLEGLDVKGKIVVTSGSASSVHNAACLQRGAEGVLSFNSPRPLADPLIMPWSGIGGREKNAKFAFALPPREGELLRDRLRRGEKITAHAKVEAASEKYENQAVTAAIRGTDRNAAEIILSAHLFEGFVKQDANDNFSGCGAILDMARTLQTLIADGRLPRPKRTIRFLWVPEISGTAVYVKAHKDQMDRTLCNINLDMVGLQLAKSLAFFTMMRTSYGHPHYINDVMENFYRYVGETNRSYVTNGMTEAFPKRIVAPSGSQEPMYYYIGTHFGSSDHEVFNDWGVGVPGIVMNTWPDLWYHTSQDRPAHLDATQLKRSVVIGAAAAYSIAAADDAAAGRIAAEIVSNASARLGHQLVRGLEDLNRAEQAQLASAYKKGRAYLEAAAINERATIDSVGQLVADPARLGKYLAAQKAAVTGLELAALKALENSMLLKTSTLGIPAVVLKPTDLEKKAAALVPKPTPKVKENGYQGYQAFIQDAMKQISAAGSAVPDRSLMRGSSELQLLCDGRNSALDIKKLLDTENRQDTSLEAVLAYLEVLKKAGLVQY